MKLAPPIVRKFKKVLARLQAQNADEVLYELESIAQDALKLRIQIDESGGYDVKWRFMDRGNWNVY